MKILNPLLKHIFQNGLLWAMILKGFACWQILFQKSLQKALAKALESIEQYYN